MGPHLDGWLLGGASVVAFFALRLLDPGAQSVAVLAVVMMALANLVNHPHFAHSYQMFYGAYDEVRRGRFPPSLRWRWWWAAAVAPAALAAFLGVAAWRASVGDLTWMAVGINVMGALVGWHYVKQGFGMVMTDAALKRTYWPQKVRVALLANAYACWAAAWVGLNSTKAAAMYWGFFSLEVPIPRAAIGVAWGVCGVTTCVTAVMVSRALDCFRRLDLSKPLPYYLLLAYFVSLYLWTVFAWADPAFLLMIPFFHSLQYLTVVWRYKLNEWSSEPTTLPVRRRAASFLLVGLVLGAAGFWLLPGAADFARFGHWPSWMGAPAIGLACAWLFINVHHYLIDNVLWRKGNPKVARYLFGAPTTHRRLTT